MLGIYFCAKKRNKNVMKLCRYKVQWLFVRCIIWIYKWTKCNDTCYWSSL